MNKNQSSEREHVLSTRDVKKYPRFWVQGLTNTRSEQAYILRLDSKCIKLNGVRCITMFLAILFSFNLHYMQS